MITFRSSADMGRISASERGILVWAVILSASSRFGVVSGKAPHGCNVTELRRMQVPFCNCVTPGWAAGKLYFIRCRNVAMIPPRRRRGSGALSSLSGNRARHQEFKKMTSFSRLALAALVSTAVALPAFAQGNSATGTGASTAPAAVAPVAGQKPAVDAKKPVLRSNTHRAAATTTTDAKPAAPAVKPTEQKPAANAVKPTDAKPGDAKPGDAKPATASTKPVTGGTTGSAAGSTAGTTGAASGGTVAPKPAG